MGLGGGGGVILQRAIASFEIFWSQVSVKYQSIGPTSSVFGIKCFVLTPSLPGCYWKTTNKTTKFKTR